MCPRLVGHRVHVTDGKCPASSGVLSVEASSITSTRTRQPFCDRADWIALGRIAARFRVTMPTRTDGVPAFNSVNLAGNAPCPSQAFNLSRALRQKHLHVS